MTLEPRGAISYQAGLWSHIRSCRIRVSLLLKHKLVQDIYNHYGLAELRPTYSNTLVRFKIFYFIQI